MAQRGIEKTNVMRLLDRDGTAYKAHCIGNEVVDAKTAAQLLGKTGDEVFKTLVTTAGDGGHYVFVIPATGELDLKKAARAAGVKSIAMLKQKDLLPLTGYIHGGCSPMGMKKPFPTFIDESAELFETICVSAGRIGYQIELSPGDLAKEASAEFADLV